MPRVEEWESFPFDGDMRPRPLRGPSRTSRRATARPASAAAVQRRRRRVPLDERPLARCARSARPACRPSSCSSRGLITREPGDLTHELAAELGVLLARIERAVRAIPHVGRVHVCRWGDGGEHLHWWFMARPTRFDQLIGSFAAIWDDILEPLPEDVWRDNIAIVARELAQS